MSYRRLRQAILLVLGLVMVLSAVSYSSLLQRGYVVMKFSALLVGASGLVALCAYLVFQDRRWKELRDPLFYLVAAEVAVLALSIAFSGQPMVSLLGSMPRLMGSITIFCFLVAAVAVALGAARRRENLLFLLRVLAATSMAVALSAIYEWPVHPSFRPPGLVGNAEFLSNYLLFGGLGSLGLMLVEKRKGWWIFASVAAAIIAVGMAVLKTRGAWLGYGAGIVAFLLVAKPWKQPELLVRQTLVRLLLLPVVGLCTAFAAALYAYATAIKPIGWHALLPFLPVMGMVFLPLPWLLPRVRILRHGLVTIIVVVTAITGYSVSTQTAVLPYEVGTALRVTQESARGIVRDDTVSMLSKYWLTGCGLENYRVAFLEFKSERVARADPRVNYRNPHNMLLYEWTANGLLGLLVYVGFIIVGVWSLLVARRREEETRWGLLAAGLLATLVAYLVNNFFNYDVIPSGLMFYVLLAMGMVLRRTAGMASPDASAKELEGGEEPAPEPEPEPESRRSKGKRRRKKATVSGRGRRLAQKVSERKAVESRWMITSLIWWGGGAVVLFMVLWGVPSIHEAFSFTITELKSISKEVPVKTDVLPKILMAAWFGFWMVVFFCGDVLRPGLPEDDDAAEDVRLPQHSWLVLGPVLFVCVSTGLWWASKQIKADYHMFRALAYSREAGRSIIPGVQRASSSLRSLKQQAQALRRQGRDDPRQQARIESRMRQLERRTQRMAPVLGKLLKRARYHGRLGAGAVNVLGYYHFQYSKVLHPFLKARRMLSSYNAVALESLQHARRSVYNNTNPESAWSHLSVVYLAAGSLDLQGSEALEHPLFDRHQTELLRILRTHSLSLAKWALARSISFDKFYYDTHRMMGLLHLQSGHIDEAVKELKRSLDITEGKHFTHSRLAALRVKRSVDEGDLVAADKARREMWHWLRRSRNFPGMPVMPLNWLRVDEGRKRLQEMAKILASGRVRQAGKRLRSLRKLRGGKRVSRFHLRFMRGVHAALIGDSGTAFELLRHLRRPLGKKTVIDEVIELVTVAVRVEQDVNQMIRAAKKGRSGKRRMQRAFSQSVGRAMGNPTMYLKIFGFVIADMVDNGEMDQAKTAAKAAARFIYLLYSRQRTDLFSGSFRQRYRQVLSAKIQVQSAASKRGRMMRAQQMLQRRKYSVALRIARGAVKKFGSKVPMAHFVMGAALESLRQPAKARQAFERYLELDPKGKYADKVRERLNKQ
jgi:tetratricopeptide (TPR) repeat protein